MRRARLEARGGPCGDAEIDIQTLNLVWGVQRPCKEKVVGRSSLLLHRLKDRGTLDRPRDDESLRMHAHMPVTTRKNQAAEDCPTGHYQQ
jgi:hypothetical protein